MTRGVAADFRLAVRSHRASAPISLAAMLTLALGIGATTAVFSVANGLIFRPLPVPEPERLVTVTSAMALRFGFQAGAGWNYGMWDRLRQRGDAFAGAFAWTLQRFDLSDGGEVQPINALVASGDMFKTLGVPALIGRPFTMADDLRGGGPDGPVLVISEDLWQRRFNGAGGIIGSRITIEGTPLTIVGVIAKSFRGVDLGQPFDIAMPFGAEAIVRGKRSVQDSERALLLTVMLRLKSGQTPSTATAALRGMQPHIVGPGAPPFLKDPFIVVPASTGISDRSQLRQRYQRPVVVLAIVAGLVLVIVCVNIANLLLARASARRYELTVRLAVGAPRWRLARQMIVDALVLGGAGAAAGVMLATWASRALLTQLPSPNRPVSIDLSMDWRVLAFAIGVSVLAVVLFGTAPAFYASRVPPLEALQQDARSLRGGRAAHLTSGLMVLQVALSIVLLGSAGLFLQTFNRLASVPLGFEPDDVLIVTVNSPVPSSDSAARSQLYEQIREALRPVPGLASIAGSIWTPVGPGGGGVLTDARGRRADLGRGVLAFNFVTPGWFAAYGTPLRAGRDFETRDGAKAPRVAIVNQTYRVNLLRGGTGIGDTIDAGPCGRDGCTVVGVVADTMYGSSLRDPPPPTVYVPLAQAADLRPDMPLRITIRTAPRSGGVMAETAAALRRVDPRLRYGFSSLIEDVRAAVAQERLMARLAGFFGVVAMLLAAIGLYGVISHTVTRRRGEIGIRVALGCQPVGVLKLVLTRVAVSVIAGTLVGLFVVMWLSRFVGPLLYGLEARDPTTLIAASATLMSVAALAGWKPASRALRIEPAEVLREH
jgi:putative ABC transport system permease protein